jgi:hypothetical protein
MSKQNNYQMVQQIYYSLFNAVGANPKCTSFYVDKEDHLTTIVYARFILCLQVLRGIITIKKQVTFHF